MVRKMAIQVLVDGNLLELPPRRAELVRQVVEADPDIDTMEVGGVEFRIAQDKISLRVTKSYPPVRLPRWWSWIRQRTAST